jgi:hypothetical protein
MKDTDFHVQDEKRDRFAASYVRDPATNKLTSMTIRARPAEASRLCSRRAVAGSFRPPTTISPSAV